MPTQSEISLNPSSAKGEILSHSGSSRVAVPSGSSTSMILTARSSTSSGLLWETPSGGSQEFVLISSASITASVTTVAFTSINTSLYKHIKFIVSPVHSQSYTLAQVAFNSPAATITFARMRANIGASSSDVNNRVINAPSTTTELRFSSFGVADLDSIPHISLDIFLSNSSATRIPILFTWGGAEQATYPDGAYDFEMVQGGGDILLSSSGLTAVYFTAESARTYQVGTKINMYGLKVT
jgi:hypothetical protein